MSNELVLAIVSSGSALLGSIVGGIVSYFTASRLNLQKWRQDRIDKEMARREQLYSEFMGEVGNLMMKSCDTKEIKAIELNHLIALQTQIRLFATDEVIESAKKLTSETIHAFREKRDKSEQPRETMERFSQLCRRELDTARRNS